MDTAVAAQQPPHPDDPDNWAHGLRTVEGAYIFPSEDRGHIQSCGVYDADRSYCHDAVLWRARALMVPPDAPDFDGAGPMVKGHYVWGGILHSHFGHFLVESLGRTWGCDALEEKPDGLLFLEKRSDGTAADEPISWHSEQTPFLRAFQTEMFEQLGITVPIGLVRRPLRIERLTLPGQGFGMGAMAAGTPAFRQFVRGKVGKGIRAKGPKRLYVSRSAFGPRRGGVIGETLIEERLAEDGYAVLHPQAESLETQIARYKAARDIVALDGSALHLVAMVASPDQKVAMIKRRSSPISKGIETHLTAFMERPPVVIDAIKQNWLRSDRKRVDRFSLAELDFPATGKALARAKMASDQHWDDPDGPTLDATIAALNAQSHYSFRPHDPTEKEEPLPEGIAAACYGIQVPMSDPVSPKWLIRKLNKGRYEKAEIAGALHLVRPEDRVLECGAGLGVVGTVVAHNCTPEKMMSFEANPHMIEVIEATYRHNGVDDRISVTHGALMAGSNLPATTEFHISRRFAYSSLDTPQQELTEKISVPVHDFETVRRAFRPTVLLMDIEGGELDFLEAANLEGIGKVVMEFHPDVYGEEGMQRCKTLLTEAGFEPVRARSVKTVWAAWRTVTPRENDKHS